MQDDKEKRKKKSQVEEARIAMDLVKSVSSGMKSQKAAALDYFKKPSSTSMTESDKAKQIGKSISKSVGSNLQTQKDSAKKYFSRPDTPLAETPEPKKYQ